MNASSSLCVLLYEISLLNFVLFCIWEYLSSSRDSLSSHHNSIKVPFETMYSNITSVGEDDLGKKTIAKMLK